MEYILFLVVGVMGMILTYKVIQCHDWDSPAHSVMRNVEFVYGAIGALGWSYCIMGMFQATISLSILIGVLICISLYFFTRYGVRATAHCLQNNIDKLKQVLSKNRL